MKGEIIVQDTMILKGMRFYGHHGHLEAEKILGQWYEVDVALTMDLSRAAVSDALEDTLNYAALYEVIRLAVERGKDLNLIEALAGRILDCCFQFTRVESVDVQVKKPQVPLGGPVAYAAVQLQRTRSQWENQRREETPKER
jgi:dihydroneopterin aldolase